jgi:putative transposon-encoded protein
METRALVVKQIGASGQISLGKEFTGRTVLIDNTEPGV